MKSNKALYIGLLLGHSHDAGDSDAAGVVMSGPNKGAREADICRDVVNEAVRVVGESGYSNRILRLPDDIDEPGGPRLPYHEQMKRAEAEFSRRAAEEGQSDWSGLILHLHADMSPSHRNRLVIHDIRSRAGKEAAQTIASIDWRMYEPCVQDIKVFRADAASRMPNGQEWLGRSYNCITGAWELPHTAAVLIEIGNMNVAAHEPLWTTAGRAMAGQWLARVAFTLYGR